MTNPFVVFLGIVAVLSAFPAWLSGSILKKHAVNDGGGGSDWIPLSLLPYGLGRFRHPHRIAVVWGYVFSNLLFAGSVIALLFVIRR